MESAIKVLEGRNDEAQSELARRMEAAAEQLNFEDAARVRDQLKASASVIQAQQIVTADIDHDADVIAIARRPRRVLRSRSCSCAAAAASAAPRSFPKAPLAELPEVLAAFVTQYYLERESPPEIIVEHDFEEMQVLEATLAERTGHKVRITSHRSAASAPAGSR